MDFKAADLIGLISRRAALILVVVVLATAASVAITIIAPISYKSQALLMIKPGRYIESNADSASAIFARQEQHINSLTLVLRSEDVMRRTVETFGAERLYPDLAPSGKDGLNAELWKARAAVQAWWERQAPAVIEFFTRAKGNGSSSTPASATPAGSQPSPTYQPKVTPEQPGTTAGLRIDRAVQRAAKSLVVGAEPKTDLIWVFFSHRDPQIARELANLLLEKFKERTIEITERNGAAAFFSEQKKRYDEAYETSLKQMNAFSVEHALYSIGEQRRFMLERQNQLLGAISATNSQIVEKRSQAQAVGVQLNNLKPIVRYPQIQKLAKPDPDFGPSRNDDIAAETGKEKSATPDVLNTASTPPLLLVRVYQDTVQTLVRLKSDIAGLTALGQYQNGELIKINGELQTLAQKGPKFDRLQLETNQARDAAGQYASYSTKEQLTAEINKKGLSTVEIVQAATMPHEPAFPNPMFIIPFGAAAGLALGLAIALMQIVAGRAQTPAQTPHRDFPISATSTNIFRNRVSARKLA